MIKILIADDHNLMIDGIKSALSDIADFKIVAKANNGLEVLKFLETGKADIILMDINMPYMDGLECTKAVIEKFPSTRVIALSQFGETRFVKKMIKSGSSGYLLKDAHKEELVKAIRMVYAGGHYFDGNLQADILQLQQLISGRNKDTQTLTKREIEILQLICNEHTTQEIADQLSISYITVEHHRANLLQKSGMKNTAGIVRWAIENDMIG